MLNVDTIDYDELQNVSIQKYRSVTNILWAEIKEENYWNLYGFICLVGEKKKKRLFSNLVFCRIVSEIEQSNSSLQWERNNFHSSKKEAFSI